MAGRRTGTLAVRGTRGGEDVVVFVVADRDPSQWSEEVQLS